MKFAKYDRHGIFFLSIVAILFIFVSIGCLQSNKSKILGRWKGTSIDNVDGSVQFTLFEFYNKGVVSKTTGIVINEKLTKQNKIMGRYKFEEDNKNILINWDNGNSEITNVNFPQENKMHLGKHEMEKIR